MQASLSLRERYLINWLCKYICIFFSHILSESSYLIYFQAVSREIRKILTQRATNFNIALDDVSITTLTFGKEFTAAIEAKQVAAQEAERAKFIVEKAEQDKRSAVIRAQVKRTCSTFPSYLKL